MPKKQQCIRALSGIALANLLIIGLYLSACQRSANLPGTELPPTPPPSATPDQLIFWQAWEAGPHADTYDLEKGPNTYCAKCHSPANWVQTAKIDPPPNCVSCKFPFEAETRLAQGNILVPEEEWSDIGCETCHRMEAGIAAAEFAWHNPVTNYYETTTTSTALCEKCHLNNETLRHKRDLGEAAHMDFACTDCHDPHSTRAGCADNGCHNQFPAVKTTPIPEHADLRDSSACTDCHGDVDLIHMGVAAGGSGLCTSCHITVIERDLDSLFYAGHAAAHENVSCVA